MTLTRSQLKQNIANTILDDLNRQNTAEIVRERLEEIIDNCFNLAEDDFDDTDLEFDLTPTDGSLNPVTSDGIYEALLSVYYLDGSRPLTGNVNGGTHSLSNFSDLLLNDGGSVGLTSGLGSFAFASDGKITATTPEFILGGDLNMGSNDIASVASLGNASALIQLNSGATNDILLTSDNGASAQSFIFLDPSEIGINYYGQEIIGLSASGTSINSANGVNITATVGDITISGPNIYNLVGGGYTKAWEELTQTYSALGFGSNQFYVDGSDAQITASGNLEISVAGLTSTTTTTTLNASTSVTLDSPAINLVGVVSLKDNTDNTKILTYDVSGITTATTRTATWQDKNITVAGINDESFTGTTNFENINIGLSGVLRLNDSGTPRTALDVSASATLRIANGSFTKITTPVTTFTFSATSPIISSGGTITLQALGGSTANNGVVIAKSTTVSNTTGDSSMLRIQGTFQPASGTGTFTALGIYPTITQSGTGTIPLLDINPTINNVGGNLYGIRSQISSGSVRWNLFADGTAKNVIVGKTSFGSTSDAASTVTVLGSFGPKVTSTSTDLTLDDTHYIIEVDASGGDVTITLPTAASINREYIIKKIDSSANTVTIDGNVSETIDGSLTYILTTQYAALDIYASGGNWSIK